MRDPNPGPLEPLGARVVIRREAAGETKSAGGIVLPETAKDPPNKGVVLALGPDVKGGLCEGETVYFNPFGGITLKAAGEDVVLFQESELLAVEHEGAKW